MIHCLFSIINVKRLRWLFLTTALLCLIIFSAVIAMEKEPGFWMFDFRDLLYDIVYLNEKKAVIVGAHGRILATDEKYPNLWRTVESHTKESLTCLSFVDDKSGWAAGHGGIIIHTSDGAKTWEIQRKASTKNVFLLDIQFVDREAGFACGAYGTVLKTTDGGSTWESINTGSDTIYNGLYFFDRNRGFIVGEQGAMLRTVNGGKTWEKIYMGSSQYTFFGIHALSATELIAYGISGRVVISRDRGNSWRIVTTETNKSIYKAASKGREVALVGRMGIVLQSKDGGTSFKSKTEEELTSFSGVAPHPAGGFICIGEMGKMYRIQPLN